MGDAIELVIARGPERAFVASGAHTRLDLPDRWISQNHACLRRSVDGWSIEDLGSRNGTRVNGRRILRDAIAPGDVIECGGTFLVLQRTDRTTHKLDGQDGCHEALRTVSPALERELDGLAKVARSSLSILLLGESGTGKEGTANAIHALSGRAGPLVAVNCAAIPSTLIESELFGSRRGAFSGAEDRPGLVRTADRGTLFLDEVAELSLPAQAALLRVLQEKQVMSIGTTRPIAVDLRVVAATNRPVTQLVTEGKLRQDLYARLRGYELRLLPLRERLEDMGLLVASLIQRHDECAGPRTLSRAAAATLFAYDWPLNIRELEHALAAALSLTTGEIELKHLSPEIRAVRREAPGSPLDERDRLVAIIERLGGNLSAVARELATSRTHVYRLLARHGIPLRSGQADDIEDADERNGKERPD